MAQIGAIASSLSDMATHRFALALRDLVGEELQSHLNSICTACFRDA